MPHVMTKRGWLLLWNGGVRRFFFRGGERHNQAGQEHHQKDQYWSWPIDVNGHIVRVLLGCLLGGRQVRIEKAERQHCLLDDWSLLLPCYPFLVFFETWTDRRRICSRLRTYRRLSAIPFTQKIMFDVFVRQYGKLKTAWDVQTEKARQILVATAVIVSSFLVIYKTLLNLLDYLLSKLGSCMWKEWTLCGSYRNVVSLQRLFKSSSVLASRSIDNGSMYLVL